MTTPPHRYESAPITGHGADLSASDPDAILLGEEDAVHAEPGAAANAEDEPETQNDTEPKDDAGKTDGGLASSQHHQPPAMDLTLATETGQASPGDHWHEIQAMFVDDPRGSVRFAAEAADGAVASLVETLRNRLASIEPSASSTDHANGTEGLRSTLRAYRTFCQVISELRERVAKSDPERY